MKENQCEPQKSKRKGTPTRGGGAREAGAAARVLAYMSGYMFEIRTDLFQKNFGWKNTWLPKRNKLEVKMLNQMESSDNKIYFTTVKSQI